MAEMPEDVKMIDRTEARPLPNGWTMIRHVKAEIRHRMIMTVWYNNHKVVWGIGEDGQPTIIHNDCPSTVAVTPPNNSNLHEEVQRWRAILNGEIPAPPEFPNAPPPFPPAFSDGTDLPG